MPKVKVIFDRQNCIGARDCAAVCPKYWGMADEGFNLPSRVGQSLPGECYRGNKLKGKK